ncbi:hypothetical protein B9Z55_013630 [Caenorhabditis nigoni]|uniref:Uncharacterized protein n=1 Tax=Caenorhabditis nigoni TaxID=1611254 RepID=A0A2G5U2S8_9PELO|nr:hypothetical protein B9Z55_013630 [Caenorhabditis nigoni]
MKPSTSNQAVRSPLITTSPKKNIGGGGPSGAQTAPVGTSSGVGGAQAFLGKWQDETNQSQGSQDFARLIHTRYLSDKEKILLDALTEYKRRNQSEVVLDCPMIGFIGSIWSPQSSHVDLFGKIISIISIRKLIQLIIRLIRCIRLKTTTEAEARKHVDETQKDLNGLAESIIETLCEV